MNGTFHTDQNGIRLLAKICQCPAECQTRVAVFSVRFVTNILEKTWAILLKDHESKPQKRSRATEKSVDSAAHRTFALPSLHRVPSLSPFKPRFTMSHGLWAWPCTCQPRNMDPTPLWLWLGDHRLGAAQSSRPRLALPALYCGDGHWPCPGSATSPSLGSPDPSPMVMNQGAQLSVHATHTRLCPPPQQ